jgi:hypothetical protein
MVYNFTFRRFYTVVSWLHKFFECKPVEGLIITEILAMHKHCGTETGGSVLLVPRLCTGSRNYVTHKIFTNGNEINIDKI